jgi:hypothetical protein
MRRTSAPWTPASPDLCYRAMSVVRELRRRLRADSALPRFEPCLPRLAKEPPAGPGWIHEIKHDGFRIIAQRDAAGVRLVTRNGYNFADCFPLIVEAMTALPARSCVVDGEAIAVDENGLSVIDLIRYRRQDHAVTLARSTCSSSMARICGERRSKYAKPRSRDFYVVPMLASASIDTSKPTAKASTSTPVRSVVKASFQSSSARCTSPAA